MSEKIHGELGCQGTERFTCMVCWRDVCWCYGCADPVDEAISNNREGTHGDCGICDECWATLSGDEKDLQATLFEKDDQGAPAVLGK